MLIKNFIISIVICLYSSLLFAANGTTVGSLTLYQTFESMGIRCAYTGDDNSNMTAVVEYKATSGSTWITAHAPMIDRSGGTYDHQVRTSLFYLTRNTAYDVRVTFTDADGVTGTNPVTGSSTTWSHDQPSYGSCSESVSTSDQLTTALSNCNGVGGTITLGNGSYTNTSFSSSGVSSGYIHIVAANKGMATFGQPVTLSGSYVHLDGLKFNYAGFTNNTYNLRTSGNALYNVISNCTFDGGHVNITTGTVTGLLLEYNSWLNMCDPSTGGDYGNCSSCCWDDGIYVTISAPTRMVVRYNDFTWTRDTIGGSITETDFYGNTIHDIGDDSIEADGSGVNVRVWNNYTWGIANSSVSLAPVIDGPVFYFNNICALTKSVGCIKTGRESSTATGAVFIYYNTFWPGGSASKVDQNNYGATGSSNITWKNNILKATGSIMQTGGCGYLFSYNNWDTSSGSPMVQWFYPSSIPCGSSVSYNTLALFKAGQPSYFGSGDISVASDMVSPNQSGSGNFNLNSSSALVRAGNPVSGIIKDYLGNSRSGSTPSIGAYEYGAATGSVSGVTMLGVTH